MINLESMREHFPIASSHFGKWIKTMFFNALQWYGEGIYYTTNYLILKIIFVSIKKCKP